MHIKCLAEEIFGKFLLVCFLYLCHDQNITNLDGKIWQTTSDSPNSPRIASPRHSHYTVYNQHKSQVEVDQVG